MSAVIRIGDTKVPDQVDPLEAEILRLKTQNNCESKNYNAVYINPEDNAGKALSNQNPGPHLVLRVNAESFTENPAQLITVDSSSHEPEYPASKICLSCTADQHCEDQSKASPPYTFHDKSTNSHYSMIIDLEPDDIDRLFRHPDFVAWLGVYKPNLLFSREFNNSEYLFYWLIYHIIKADNKVTEGLHNGLSSLFPQVIGGLFNFIFTDGTGAYAYSQIAEMHSGNDAILFRIQRDGHNEYKYILRNSLDDLENDWIHLRPNCLYYFPISGELRYYMFLNSLGNIEVRPGKNRHLGLHFLF